MIDEKEEERKSNEPTTDKSMEGAFDFDMPDSNLDDVSDDDDESDDNSAPDAGDDNSAENSEDTGEQVESEEKGTIDPKLLVRVGRMGLSDEETDRVLGLGSDKAITDVLDLLESRKGQFTREGVSGEAISEDWYEISEEAAEEFAPELVDMLKSMNGSTRKAVEQMFAKYEQKIHAIDNYAFEDAIESLGKDWEPVLGKEDNVEQLRKAVFSDKYKGSVAKRVKAATKDIFNEHTQKIAKDAKVQKARSRQSQFIGRPAHRNKSDADLSPTAKAISNAAKFMKERGMYHEYMGSYDTNEDL